MNTYKSMMANASSGADIARAELVRIKAVDEIAAESIMIYPPGIPIVIPGEIVSQDILDDLDFYQRSGSVILSDTEGGYIKIIDKEYWEKWSELYEDE